MRKYFLLIFIFLCGHFCAKGQYKINKTKYETNGYVYENDDPYVPFLCGFASYLMPGLGQIIAGETLRGLTFTAISGVGAATAISVFVIKPLDAKTEAALLGSGMALVIGTSIWSIVDAVKVAKVNNLAYRDRKKSASVIYLQPCFVCNGFENRQFMGALLKVSF